MSFSKLINLKKKTTLMERIELGVRLCSLGCKDLGGFGTVLKKKLFSFYFV